MCKIIFRKRFGKFNKIINEINENNNSISNNEPMVNEERILKELDEAKLINKERQKNGTFLISDINIHQLNKKVNRFLILQTFLNKSLKIFFMLFH